MEKSAEFQAFALRHLDSLYNYSRLLTRNEAEAEDLVQETLLRSFRALATWNGDLQSKWWLLKIMKNAHIDLCRRRLSRPVEEELGEEPGPAGPYDGTVPAPVNPEEILLRRLAIEEVRAAIRRLPQLWREAVELRDIEGLSYREIAEVIGKPLGTVMSRLSRGRNLLRAILKDRPKKDDANPAIPLRRIRGL